MMRVDDLVAAIAALQRSDLEDWIREELIVPQEEAGEQLFSEMEYAESASSPRCSMSSRSMRTPYRSFFR